MLQPFINVTGLHQRKVKKSFPVNRSLLQKDPSYKRKNK